MTFQDFVNGIKRRASMASIRSVRSSNGSIKSRQSKREPSSTYTIAEMGPSEPFILRSSSATRYLLEAIAETPHGKRTLARLARTCKALQEPCLDILWRELDSIVPLVGLFPDDILKKARRPGLGLVCVCHAI